MNEEKKNTKRDTQQKYHVFVENLIMVDNETCWLNFISIFQ